MPSVIVNGISTAFMKRDINSIYKSILFENQDGDIDDINESLLTTVISLYSFNVLRKKGYLYELQFFEEKADKDKAFLYIHQNIDTNITEVSELYKIYNNELVNQNLLVVEFLKQNYSSYDKTNAIEINDTYSNPITLSIGSIEINNTIYHPKIVNNRCVINNNKLVMVDGNGNELEINYEPIDDVAYACFYNTDNEQNIGVYLLYSNIQDILNNLNILTIPTKLDGIGNRDKQYFILNKFGLKDYLNNTTNEDSIGSIYNNDKYKNMLFTYAVEEDYELTQELVQTIYEPSNDKWVYTYIPLDNGNKLKVLWGKVGGYDDDKWHYSLSMLEVSIDSDGNETLVEHFGKTKIEDLINKPVYPIPIITEKNKYGLKDKIDLYQDSLSMFLSVTEERHIAWYQTWWGQLIIGIGIGALTGGIAGAMTSFLMTSFTIAINAELGSIVGKNSISFVLITITSSLIAGNISNAFNLNNSLQLASAIQNDITTANLLEKREELKTKEEKIHQLSKEMIRNRRLKVGIDPYGETHSAFDIIYNNMDYIFNSTTQSHYIKLGA